jgi:hypothetical protein
MPYTAEISRANPTCFLFLIDHSGSMDDGWGGDPSKKKADELAVIINRLIQNLVLRCTEGDFIKDRYSIGVIGYGATVEPAFGGKLVGQEIWPVSLIGNSPLRIDERLMKVSDGAGGIIEQNVKFPIWFDPVAVNGTPMCQAFNRAKEIITNWVNEHPSCYPPTVVNITDGESTDGDPTSIAENIKSISSTDGNVLLYNLHISSQKANPIEYPSSKDNLIDQYAKMLFEISSILPPNTRNEAQKEHYEITESSRGFVFQADMVSVIQFLDIGTRASR